MKNSETVAYPPRPPAIASGAGRDTQAATMMATPSSVQTLVADGLPSNPTTLVADGVADGVANQVTMAAPAAGGSVTVPPGGTRGYATVLPDVRSEGEQLIIVPNEKLRFENQKLLGRGGMGEVKLARDHDIGRKIAVKRLIGEQSPHAIARFIDEVRTVGSLEHPNIVPIHDVGVDENGAYFFVMKYVEGETLGDVIEKLAAGDAEYHKRYTFEARLDLFAGLLRALQYAHSRGLVHRDVKPENIMIGSFGEVVLMDWGIAHHMRSDDQRITQQAIRTTVERASTETVDGAVVGTPQYMSPEQASGEVATLDGRSDIYSAMIVLYELLTMVPYIEAGKSPMQTVLAAAERQPPEMSDEAYHNEHQGSVPVELRHYMLNGLANDREHRFFTAEEALSMLEQVRAGDFVGCPVTFMKANNTRMGRFMDRHPGLSMGLALASALSFVGGLAGWVMWALG